jgi:ubiquinone biosynthesis protein Coq4
MNLPEPYNRLAQIRCSEYRTKMGFDIVAVEDVTLTSAFVWGSTKEGHDFWHAVAINRIKDFPEIPESSLAELEKEFVTANTK